MDIGILVRALLDQKSKKDFEQEVKNIEKSLDPLKLKIDLDEKDFKKINLDKIVNYSNVEGGFANLKRLITEVTTETGKQIKLLSHIDEKTKAIAHDTLIVVENYKKQRAELEKAKKLEESIRRRNFNFGKLIEGVDASQFKTRESFADYIKKQYGETAELIGTFNDKQLKTGEIITQTVFRVREGTDKWRVYQATINKTTGELRLLDKGLKDVINRHLTLSQMVTTAASKMLIWVGVGDLIFGTFRNIRDGLDTLKEIDTLMYEIAKVTDLPMSSIKQLANESFDVASKYGRIAQDYLQSVVEFSRAGYEESADKLAELSVLAQNVGELTAEQANAFLLATDAAYKYAGSQEKLARVLDGVNEIDNKYATSIQKVAEGITVAGSVASNASVDIDQLAAAIGTITAVTQRSGNEAGRAFRTLIMNIRQIKGEIGDGEFIDDESIAKAEKALNNVGIRIREIRNGVEELRNPMDVLEELANKWEHLTTVQQSMIIESLAGKYRANQLAALLENFDMYKKMLEDFSNATGSALLENERRMESWQAKANRFANTVSEMWNNQINTDGIKALIDMGTNVVELIDKFGLLNTVIVVLNISLAAIGKMGAVNKFFIDLAGALTTATISVNALKAAFSTLWPVLAVTAVFGLSKAFQFLNKDMEDYRQSVEESYNEIQQNIDNINKLKVEYENLARTESLSSEQKLRLIEIERELKTKYGETAQAIDLQNKSLEENLRLIDEVVKEEARRFTTLNKREYEEAKKLLENPYTLEIFPGQGMTFKNIDEAIKYFEKRVAESINSNMLKYNALKKTLEDLYKKQEAARDIVDKYNQSLEILNQTVDDNTKALGQNAQAQGGFSKGLVESSESLGDLTETFEKVTGKIQDYYKYLKELNEDGKLSGSSLEEIITKYQELLPYLGDEIALRNKINELIKQHERTQAETYRKMLEHSTKFYNSVIKANTQLVNKLRDLYGINLKDYNTLAEAKLAIDLKLISTLASAWSEFFDAQGSLQGRFIDGGRVFVDQYGKEHYVTPEMRQQLYNLHKAQYEAKKMLDGIAAKYSNINFGTINLSGISKDKGTDKSKKVYYDEIFRPMPDYKERAEDIVNKRDRRLEALEDLESKIYIQEVLANETEEIEQIRKVMEMKQKYIEQMRTERQYISENADALRKLQQEVYNKFWVRFGKNIGRHLDTLKEVDIKKFDDQIEQKIINYRNQLQRISDEAKANEIRRLIENLEYDKKLFHNLIETYKYIGEQIKEGGEKVNELTVAMSNLRAEIKSQLEDWADEVVEIYKKMYEKQKEVALKAIDDELDKLEEAHSRKMKMLDEELEKYEDIYGLMLKTLEREAEEEDYEKQLNKLQQERQEILNKINILSLDDSLEARAQVYELNKQLAAKEEEIEELKINRSRQLRRQNIEDQREAKRKEIELEKKNAKYVVRINEQKFEGTYEAARKWLEKQRKETEQYWEDIINDERHYANIRKNIIEGNLNDIRKDFAGFFDFLITESATVGQTMANNLIDKLNEASKKINLGVNSSNYQSYNPSPSTSSSGNRIYIGGDGNIYIVHDDNSVTQVNRKTGNTQIHQNNPQLVEALKQKGTDLKTGTLYRGGDNDWYIVHDDNSVTHIDRDTGNREYIKNNSELVNALKQKGIKIRHKGGFVESPSVNSRELNLVDKMFNLKSDETLVKALKDEFFTPTRNIIDNFIPNLRNLLAMVATPTPIPVATTPGSVSYYVDVRIDKVTGDKEGAKTLIKEFINEVKKRGGKF